MSENREQKKLGTEQRRIGFELPPEVFEQLLQECAEDPISFWEAMKEYYNLSPLQGDSIICGKDFSAYVERETGSDKPTWVYEQEYGLKKMQCFILAGPTRGQVLLDTLEMIRVQRDEAAEVEEKEVRETKTEEDKEEEVDDLNYNY